MHTVYICVGTDYDLVKIQIFYSIFYVERMLEQVEFFVFVDYFFGHAIAIERLTPQTEYCLCLDITGFGQRTGSTISFCDKQGSRQPGFFICFVS